MESYIDNEAIQATIEPFLESIKPFIAMGMVLSVVIVIFFIINTIMKVRSQKAILDIRRTINEINERQKNSSVAKAPVIEPTTKIEAQTTNQE